MTKKQKEGNVFMVLISSFPLTYLIPVTVGHFLLNVHCQHLATEGQALGLLDHLLVR